MTVPTYFSKYPTIRFERETDGVLTMSLHSQGGPLNFTAADHEAYVDAFYEVGRDRDNTIVILTGAGGDFIPGIDFGSFGDVSDPDVWSKVHDEGTQLLENIANIRVPMIFALEGRAHVHAEYGLLANLIVAGEGRASTICRTLRAASSRATASIRCGATSSGRVARRPCCSTRSRCRPGTPTRSASSRRSSPTGRRSPARGSSPGAG